MDASLKNWLLASRPRTLTAAVVPVLVSMALARYLKFAVEPFLILCLFVSAISIQVATNLFNDVLDFKKGADKDRLGPTRVTQAGLIAPEMVLKVAIAFCVVAFAFGVPLVMSGGWPIAIIGLISIFLAYGYTGGPFPLAYKGLGDLFVIVFFGVIAVGGSFYVLTRHWYIEVLVLGVQVGLLAAVLIAVNNLRDSETDAKANKKTLAVRFGDRFVRLQISVMLALSYALCYYWVQHFYQWFFMLFWTGLPITIKLLGIIWEEPKKPEQLIRALAMSAFLHVFFGLTFTVVCVVAR